MEQKKLLLGIDVGSTTVKTVITDSDNKDILYSKYQRHFSKVKETVTEQLETIKEQFGNCLFKVAITGSAGLGLANASGITFVQEVHSSFIAVKERYPKTDVVIELGGEDAKIIFLTGGVEQRMNGSCAGGTGAFIDQMATLLKMGADEMDKAAQAATRTYTIASRCGVFAKSDIQPLINQGAAPADIAGSIYQAVVNQTIAGLAQGLAAVFTDLTTNIGPQLLQTGIDLLGKLGEGLVTGIPQLLAQALPVAASLASGLRENAGQLVDAGIQFILNLATGLMNGLPTMIAYLPGIVSDIAGIINDNAPKLLVAGVQLIVTLGQGLIQAIPALVENIPQILMAVANVITAFNWLNLGGNIIKLLGNGIKGMKGALTSGFKSVLDGGINYIKSLPAKFIEWGKDMIMGLVKGITGSVGAVVGAVKNVASTIATYIHFSRPDVGPLRLYEQWMPDFMSGLAKGIRDNLWMVEDAADALALTTAQPMQLQVAGVLRGNQQTAAASWQPQPGVAYQQTNNFYTHDSLSESELTREAEDMMNRLRWGIP